MRDMTRRKLDLVNCVNMLKGLREDFIYENKLVSAREGKQA